MKKMGLRVGVFFVILLSFSAQAQKEEEREQESSQETDCSQIRVRSPNAPSGLYTIKPSGAKSSFKVYCEMREDGGWIVFQRRSGGAVSFNNNWKKYKLGFGKLKHDHWLGLNKVSLLTQEKTWTLRVDLWDHEGGSAYALYKNFRIENEKAAFKLHIGQFSGTAGDAFRGSYPGVDQNGFGFSTEDRDNDGCSPCFFGDIAQLECTFSAGGGWWFSSCGSAALNGEWHSRGDHLGWATGLHWDTWKRGLPYSLKATRMMIQPTA